jgi:hypothetical protein
MAKSIADQWEIFVRMIEIPAGLEVYTRAAFFSGAAACLSSLIDDKHEPWDQSAIRIKNELELRAAGEVRH